MTDATRLRFFGGATILAGALTAVGYYGVRDRVAVQSASLSAPPVTDLPRREPAAPARPAAENRARDSSVPAIRGEAGTARAAETPRPAPPRFDVVRMGARGTVVVAGRAAPGAEVVLHEGGREIGRARADARGEWVILPSDPLGAGARELSLRARLAGGEEIIGPDTVLVVGPGPAEPSVAQAPAREAPASRVAQREATPAGAETGARTREAASGALGHPAEGAAPPAGSEEALAGPPASRAAPARPEQALVLLLPPTASAAPRALSAPPAGEAPPVTLGLDVVDYDDGRTMRFAGTAPPGARLRLYADDRHLGDAAADPAGRWSLTPAEAPPLGRHTLRVDQITALPGTGTGVSGRIEVAFQRESLPAGAVRDGQVVVQPGNNLWRLARGVYGQGIRYTVIYRATQAQIRNPARIYPGQVFAVPGGR